MKDTDESAAGWPYVHSPVDGFVDAPLGESAKERPLLEYDDSEPDNSETLESSIKRGAVWSLLNNATSRLASIASGIILARLLVPEDYGVFAVALIVLSALLSINELGVSVAIVRWESGVDRIAPTVTTLSIVSSIVLYALCFASAPSIAQILNAPDATGVIRVLSLAVLFDGAASVSAAFITRAFEQRKRMVIDLTGFSVGTSLSIVLAFAGFGGWAIALGFLATSIVASALNIMWTPIRVLPGFDRQAARELLAFGLPLAGSSFLLFALLNLDYIVVGSQLDTERLGLYLLAFNLAAWPISLVSVAVRRVSLAGFSRVAGDEAVAGASFSRALGAILVITLPMCVLLACYAAPLIDVLYGDKWSAAAPIVSWLCVLAGVRLVAELGYDYLVALGRTRSNLLVQFIWVAALIPALLIGATLDGTTGVAIGHAFVGTVVVLPILILMLTRCSVSLREMLRSAALPLLGSVAIAVTALGVNHLELSSFATVLAGGVVGLVVYAVIVAPMRKRLQVVATVPRDNVAAP